MFSLRMKVKGDGGEEEAGPREGAIKLRAKKKAHRGEDLTCAPNKPTT